MKRPYRIRKMLALVLSGVFFGAIAVAFWPRGEGAVEFAALVPLHDKGVATYYVDGQISGLGKVQFMVDTGAGYTTINQETLKELQERKLAEYSRELSGVLADGSRLQVPVYRLTSITLGNCELRGIEAAVFPGATRFLLGMNALRQTAPFAFVTHPKPQLALGQCTLASL